MHARIAVAGDDLAERHRALHQFAQARRVRVARDHRQVRRLRARGRPAPARPCLASARASEIAASVVPMLRRAPTTATRRPESPAVPSAAASPSIASAGTPRDRCRARLELPAAAPFDGGSRRGRAHRRDGIAAAGTAAAGASKRARNFATSELPARRRCRLVGAGGLAAVTVAPAARTPAAPPERCSRHDRWCRYRRLGRTRGRRRSGRGCRRRQRPAHQLAGQDEADRRA